MNDDLNKLSAEITTLTGVWCELVNIDHHKDRDCHWGIDVVWSYGDGPKFKAWHEGYVYKRISQEFRNMNAAMVYIRDQVKAAINSQRDWANRTFADEDYYSQDDAKSVISILEKAGWGD